MRIQGKGVNCASSGFGVGALQSSVCDCDEGLGGKEVLNPRADSCLCQTQQQSQKQLLSFIMNSWSDLKEVAQRGSDVFWGQPRVFVSP